MTAAEVSAATDRSLGRDTLVVTVCTMFSRLTGFGRVLATAAVLGSGLLGDVYQTANMIPNLLFELVALGVLQAVLLPSYVEARRTSGDRGLGEAVQATLGVIVVGLGVVSLLAMAASPLIARFMVALDPSSEVVADKLDVMIPMVLIFVPQLVFYGIAMATSAALNARGHYIAAALSPAVNNVVVIIACLLFRWSRSGAVADLDLSVLEFSLIAVGTTVGVVAFGLSPALTLGRRGVSWRPRWLPRHPAVRLMRQSFGWATLSIVGTFVPTVAALALGNGAPGGVAVFVFSFAFFVLPHALVAVPIATALAPRVVDRWLADDRASVRTSIDASILRALPLLSLGGAGMMALAWPLSDVMAFGQIASQGVAPIAYTLVAFGPGLIGYGVSFILTRVLFSLSDIRGASRLMVAGAGSGVAVMALLSAVVDPAARAAALAAGYGAAQTVTAALLWWRVHHLTGALAPAPTLRRLLHSVAAGGVSVLVMVQVTSAFGDRRRESAAAIAVAGTVGVVLFAALMWRSVAARRTAN